MIFEHTVDIGIDLRPVLCLDLSYETRKDFVDVFLMLGVDGGWQLLGSSVPRYPLVSARMGEYAQRLPAVIMEGIRAKPLLRTETVGRHGWVLADVAGQRHDAVVVVAHQ